MIGWHGRGNKTKGNLFLNLPLLSVDKTGKIGAANLGKPCAQRGKATEVWEKRRWKRDRIGRRCVLCLVNIRARFCTALFPTATCYWFNVNRFSLFPSSVVPTEKGSVLRGQTVDVCSRCGRLVWHFPCCRFCQLIFYVLSLKSTKI